MSIGRLLRLLRRLFWALALPPAVATDISLTVLWSSGVDVQQFEVAATVLLMGFFSAGWLAFLTSGLWQAWSVTAEWADVRASFLNVTQQVLSTHDVNTSNHSKEVRSSQAVGSLLVEFRLELKNDLISSLLVLVQAIMICIASMAVAFWRFWMLAISFPYSCCWVLASILVAMFLT